MAISIVSSIQEEHITVKYIHIGKTKEALLTSKRRPFAWQKMPFYTSKGALLQRKRRPFTLPFVIV